MDFIIIWYIFSTRIKKCCFLLQILKTAPNFLKKKFDRGAEESLSFPIYRLKKAVYIILLTSITNYIHHLRFQFHTLAWMNYKELLTL